MTPTAPTETRAPIVARVAHTGGAEETANVEIELAWRLPGIPPTTLQTRR